MTVDQNAEWNAVEESRREQLLRLRPGRLKRRFARGLARFLVLFFALFLAFGAAFFVRLCFGRFGQVFVRILLRFLVLLLARFLSRFFAELRIVLLIKRLAQNLPQFVLAQGLVLAHGQFFRHRFGGYRGVRAAKPRGQFLRQFARRAPLDRGQARRRFRLNRGGRAKWHHLRRSRTAVRRRLVRCRDGYAVEWRRIERRRSRCRLTMW